MATIQTAESHHIPGMVKLGIKALTEDPIPNQRISTEKLQKLAENCVLVAHNYAIVSEQDGEVVASLCALVDEQLVYTRRAANVVQFYTTVPGEGEKLIRTFLEWARGQRRIKCICFTLEAGADPRIGKLLERMGLTLQLPVFAEWK